MIRVALVGAGGMARRYRAVYTRIPGVQFVLAVDLIPENLEACRELGVSRLSNNFADALADDIDMLDISTPNHLHEEQAVAALKANKHVFLQKPMANSLPSADKILAAARTSKGKLGMFMSAYDNPWNWEIKQMIQKGALGKIQSVRARDAHRGGLRAGTFGDNWRSSKEKTGGGSFIQLSIHSLNLMQWFLDSKINQIFAYGGNQYCQSIGGDDVMAAVTRFDSGVYGSFESGYASDGMTREVYGTKGWVRITDWDTQLVVMLDEPYEGQHVRYTHPGQVMSWSRPDEIDMSDATNPYNQQRMFIESIQNGREPLMTGEAGRRDLALVMAAYESAETGRTVSF